MDSNGLTIKLCSDCNCVSVMMDARWADDIINKACKSYIFVQTVLRFLSQLLQTIKVGLRIRLCVGK